MLESALRRDRWIVIAGLGAMTALSWAYLLSGAGTGMSVFALPLPPPFAQSANMPMDDMAMSAGAWVPSYAIIMLLMWWVMMIAMMTPSAAPMILLHARATRHAQAGGQLQAGAVPTAAFAAGYLLMWLGFSLVATSFTWLAEQSNLVSAMTMSSNSARLSAVILVLAGLYQLSPLKRACLSRCRNPADFLARHWRPGVAGALRMGLEHGFYCVGCCWMLMALLFVGGIMSVLWIAILALAVLLEKLAPRGPRLAAAGGVVLLVWGATRLLV